MLTVHASTLQDLQEDLGRFDCAVAFNSGMIHYPSWPAALLKVRALGCPFAVTAWVLHEVAGVYQLLKDAGFGPAVVSSNAFASQVEHPWGAEDRASLYVVSSSVLCSDPSVKSAECMWWDMIDRWQGRLVSCAHLELVVR